MDRFCCVLWTRLCVCLLLCVLSVSSYSATRKHVTMPTNSSVVNSGNGATRSGDLLNVPGDPLEGEYIPSSYSSTKGTKLPVKPTYDYSIPRTLKGMTNNLRGGVYGVVLGVGLQYMLDSVDAIIEDGKVRVPSLSPVSGGYYWTAPNTSTKFESAASSCEYVRTTYGNTFSSYKLSPVNDATYKCIMVLPSGSENLSVTLIRNGTGCPVGAIYDYDTGACMAQTGTRDATDADYDLMEAAANAKDSDWLKDRLREHCEGGLSPESCYESLRDSVSLDGPASVAGPTSTTSGTYTKPDGTTGTTSTTTTNNYTVSYGPTYYDYSKTTVVTKTEDGVPVSEETTTEEEAVTEEEQQETPVPCSSNCDGPAYADQYTPTTVQKEGVIDDYLSRVGNAPILAAGAGFLSVSVGGSCPVWEVHESLNLFSESMAIDLVFDFHCLPWFIDFQPFAAIIMSIVCAFFAFRIAMLD